MKSKAKLSKAEIKKLEDNTKFTRAEILRWYKGFIQVRHQFFIDKIAIFVSIPGQEQALLMPVIFADMRVFLRYEQWFLIKSLRPSADFELRINVICY